MAGVALGVNSINSQKYLDQMRNDLREPLIDEKTGRVKNVLVVNNDGNIEDSLIEDYAPHTNPDKTTGYVRLTNIPLPPLTSAVEFSDARDSLPSWLKGSAVAKPGEPGAFYFPIETTKGKWYIIVVLDSANSLTDILQRQTTRSAYYTLALLLVTTVVTGLFVWRFTRPVKYLSNASQRVAHGDFDVRVPSNRRDEMGTLATAFNEMTARLGRMRELESKLHQVEKAAVVGRLAAAIAHEIRNPLNYINLTLDHLRSSFAPADPTKKEVFERLASQLKSEVQRINRHITDFLKYSRPSALELEPLNLHTEAEDAMRVIAGRAAEQNVATTVQQEGTLPLVTADRDSLRSVFTNLFINSLESIDGEGGSLDVKLSADDAEHARVEISDSGSGIPAEDIAKIFEPYFSTKETGTGLGLAIVKKAIDDHRGSISVSSKEGSGTTFTILLPIRHEEERMRDEG